MSVLFNTSSSQCGFITLFFSNQTHSGTEKKTTLRSPTDAVKLEPAQKIVANIKVNALTTKPPFFSHLRLRCLSQYKFRHCTEVLLRTQRHLKERNKNINNKTTITSNPRLKKPYWRKIIMCK